MKYVVIIVLIVVACLAVRVSLVKIGPDEIGVRTVNFGGGLGIVNHDYGPGYHRNLWPFDSWQKFPSTVQRMRFAADALAASGQPLGELQLVSADGDRVLMTAEVVYRIAEGQAHRVLQDSGAERRFEDVARTISQDAVRSCFGGLRTEAFYNQASREEVRRQASAELSKRLKQRNIELIDLLVENLEFDPNYETLIKQKKIADQQVLLQKAKAKAAEETGKVAKIKAEAAVKVQKIERETEATKTKVQTEANLQAAAMAGEASRYAKQKDADGALYESEKKAEGQRLIKLAQAEGTLRLNAALAGQGGQNLVALEAAKSLKLVDVTFPSFGYEWFNPRDMASRLGGTVEPTTRPASANN